MGGDHGISKILCWRLLDRCCGNRGLWLSFLTCVVLCYDIAGTYALVITGREALGIYKGSPIYRVTSLKVLSCNNNLHTAPAEEVCF